MTEARFRQEEAFRSIVETQQQHREDMREVGGQLRRVMAAVCGGDVAAAAASDSVLVNARGRAQELAESHDRMEARVRGCEAALAELRALASNPPEGDAAAPGQPSSHKAPA